MSHDLFDDEHLEALDSADQSQVDQLRTSAQIAATRTFGPFNDVPDSPFYAAEDLSPEQTWEQIAERVGLATVVAVIHGMEQRPLSVDAIRRLHEIIFLTTFPAHAGHLRNGTRKGVRHRLGHRRAAHRQERTRHGRRSGHAPSRAGLPRVQQRNRQAEATRRDRSSKTSCSLRSGSTPKVLSTHPFLDGNGRTAFTILQYALIRGGLSSVAWTTSTHTNARWESPCAATESSRMSLSRR